MGRENQRIAITKQLLKVSLMKILKEKNIDNVSVTELCREAGINRATFYRHYEIPRDILMEIQKDVYYQLREKIPFPKSSEDIRHAIEILCCYLEEHIDILGLLIRNNSDTDFSNFVNDIFLDLWKEFGSISQKKLNQEDLQILALYSAGGSYFVLRSWMMGNLRKTSREMADYVYTLMDNTAWNTIIHQFLPSIQ